MREVASHEHFPNLVISRTSPRNRTIIHPPTMRPLTDQETERLFEKLASYMGRNITHLIDRPDDPHVFRLQRERVYYVRESIAKLATSVARDKLLSIGTCLGKFTKKTGKFKLHITALDHIAPHAKFKVWVKSNGEMPYLYGNHVVKAHVGRMSEDTPEHQGVLVYSMNDTPLVSGPTSSRVILCAVLMLGL